MEQHENLVNLTTIHIRGRLNGGTNTCWIKGCTEETSKRKISCLAGVYELKLPPDILQQENDLSTSLYICNHHHYFQTKRGHKPRKLYSSVENAKKNILVTKIDTSDLLCFLGVRTCIFCKKDVVVTRKTPCSQHTLTISSKPYMCACNCLDEIKDGKIQEITSDKYDFMPYKGVHFDELSYICTECSSSVSSIKANNSKHNSEIVSESTCKAENGSMNTISEIQNLKFSFSEAFVSDSDSSRKLINYKDITDMLFLLSKVEFSPWDVYLQHGKTGVMLHFLLIASSETLPTTKLTIFCTFLFGAPYRIASSVYALGKKVDSGFLPYSWFGNEAEAKHGVSDLLQMLFSLKLCLGIYDERFLNSIKCRHLTDDDASKPYEIDTKFLLMNHYGKKISETMRSVNQERPCKRLVCQPKAERCQSCHILLKNTNIHEKQKSFC